MKTFLATQYHGERAFSVRFEAEDWDQAEDYCSQYNLFLDGEHHLDIEIPPEKVPAVALAAGKSKH